MSKQKKKKENIVTGIIKIHSRGFGFIKPVEMEEEVFIPKQFILGAVDGDFVEALVSPEVSEKGFEGKILHILRRGRSHLGGTVITKLKDGSAYAYVPLLSEKQEMKLFPSKERGFEVGDRVIIRVLDWGGRDRECQGEVVGFIGHISDPSKDIPAAIEEFELSEAFPDKVVREAKAYGKSVSLKDIKDREDLRHLECFTIDPDTAKDFDDALSLSIDKKGRYLLGIHIADVTHYVKPGSQLDIEAKERCNSTYFPGSVIPMLPHELSSHLCSLMPNVNRLAVSIMVVFDKDGNQLEFDIVRSVIKSRKRFSYGEAKEVLDGKKKNKYKKELFLMVDLCHRLKRKRYERGSIEFAIPDTNIIVDDQGMPQRIELVEYDITHQLVEEFMLKANEIVATFLSKQGKPLTYRVHEEPNPENMKDFAMRCRTFGFDLSDKPTGEELQNLFDQVRSSPFGQFIATSFIRSMKLASYSVQNIGHYGLGLEYYTHFTSPIRRYIDLIVHRVLFNHLSEKDNLDEIAKDCSEKERHSAKAEGAVRTLKKLRLINILHENDPKKCYEATITQVKPFGVVFEVTDFLLDGFFHLSQLDGDYYHYNEGKQSLVGSHTKEVFASGSKIIVSVESVNLITREVKWKMSGDKKKKHRR